MRPIAISLSPNTDRDDVVLARQLITRPELWEDSASVHTAAATLGRIVPGRLVALTSSGRSALHSILKAWQIGAGDEVILQAFTCIAVAEPILWRHATPVYVDIAPHTYTMDIADLQRKLTSRTKAIIVQHTFGIPAPIKEIMALAKAKHIPVIEDCAHAVGSTYYDQVVGTFADAAIFSFGRDKAFSSVFGGAVISSNPSLIATVIADQNQLPYPPASWVRQQLIHPLLINAALPLYNIANLGKYLIAAARELHLISRAVEPAERQGEQPAHIHYRYSPALAYLLNNQLEKYADYTARRRSLGQRYFSALSQLSDRLPHVPDHTTVAWLRFPLSVPDPQRFHEHAKTAGLILGDWYDTVLAPRNAVLSLFQYQPGFCPVAEAASQHVINLPTYPLLTDTQVDSVIKFAKAQA